MRRRSIRAGSTSTQSATPPFIVTASGCAPPIPPSPPVSVTVPGERAAEALRRALGERLVRALQDALGPDVDPRARGHLPVHREPGRLELAERVPVRPLRHEHRVRDQHPRRLGCVRNTPTGLPDCTSRVSSSRERLAASARSRRTPPTIAPPGRSRRRRRGPRGARPRRDRGCSSACASRPPAATTGRSARCLWVLGSPRAGIVHLRRRSRCDASIVRRAGDALGGIGGLGLAPLGG